ncbi:DNA (cytosine-5)-methyltransferase 1-like isoform 2-T2 [Megaptera novaeangliae]
MKAVIKKVLQMEGVPSQRLKDLERHSLTEKNGAHAFSREVNGCLENGSQTSGEERRVEIAEKKKSPKPVSKLCMPRRSKSDGETKCSPESTCSYAHPTLGLRGPQLEGPAKELRQEEARGHRASARASAQRGEALTLAATCMDPENTMLSERSQTQKDTQGVTPLRANVQNREPVLTP